MQLEFRDEQTVQLTQGGGKEPLLWTFDRVFHGSCSQSDIFELAAKETAEDVLRGYNGTIFAYGQVRFKLARFDFWYSGVLMESDPHSRSIRDLSYA